MNPTPVRVDLSKNKVPSKTDVRDIIGAFLTEEWPFVAPETLSISYHSSFANAHCHVQRPQLASDKGNEPWEIFIKFHNDTLGDLEVFKELVPDKSDEAALCYEYGRTGLGAKCHGFFETEDGTRGRVDEFLNARNMEPEDVEDSAIRADIARALATFHLLRTSLEDIPVEQYYEIIIHGLENYRGLENLKMLGREGGVNIAKLIDFDFGQRLREVVRKLKSIGGKRAWCIHDVQFMNVMVKKDPKEGESKIALIDFEFVMQNYRALDIGGHFMQKMFKWFNTESKIANCRKYTEQEKRHFCDEYCKQWNLLTGDSDTGSQVFLESEYGYMLAIIFDIHNMLCFMNQKDDRDPLNLIGLNKLFEEFVNQYDKLGLSSSTK